MQRFFGDTDGMNADNNRIGLFGPIHRGSLRPCVLYPMRSNNRDRKLTSHQEIGGVGVTRLCLRILLREDLHVFPPRLVSHVRDHASVPFKRFCRQTDLFSFSFWISESLPILWRLNRLHESGIPSDGRDGAVKTYPSTVRVPMFR